LGKNTFSGQCASENLRRIKMRGIQSITKGVMILLLILMAFIFVGCPGPTIKDLKGPEWQKYVGKSVTVEAIFVRDPLPMLVTDLNIVLANTPMPDDKYIVLTGKEAEAIDSRQYGGARLKLKGIVKAIEDTIKYKGELVTIDRVTYDFRELREPYYTEIYRWDTLIFWLKPRRYAILFSGGFNSANNHTRYWNDLKFMYSTLINEYGYTDDRIYVLYADGNGRDNQMTVDYAATETNLKTVVNELKGKTTTDDFIFVFTTNHGGGFLASDLASCNSYGGSRDANGDEGEEPLYESIYNKDFTGDGDKTDQIAWDEVLYRWGGNILDDSCSKIFSGLRYKRMVVVMEQCFSGGYIFDMARSGGNKVIMSAAGEYEFSYGGANYDIFSYHFTCAINGKTPDGVAVNADADGDGKVSMVEAFNHARTNDTANETPWYEDNGDGVAHSGAMPALGEGTLGSATFLQ
jgi:hypothetical protein